MKAIKLKFMELKVNKFDHKNDKLLIDVFYKENDDLNKVSRELTMEEGGIMFARDIVNWAKRDSKRRHGISGKDVFGNYGNVMIDEFEEGAVEKNLINIINELKNKVKYFRAMKTSDGYFDKLFEIRGYKAKLN